VRISWLRNAPRRLIEKLESQSGVWPDFWIDLYRPRIGEPLLAHASLHSFTSASIPLPCARPARGIARCLRRERVRIACTCSRCLRPRGCLLRASRTFPQVTSSVSDTRARVLGRSREAVINKVYYARPRAASAADEATRRNHCAESRFPRGKK